MRTDQPLTAFVGPTSSFHEFVTWNFEQLTDDEWKDLYETGAPTGPDWTFAYLADADGNVRTGSRSASRTAPEKRSRSGSCYGLVGGQSRKSSLSPITAPSSKRKCRSSAASEATTSPLRTQHTAVPGPTSSVGPPRVDATHTVLSAAPNRRT
jgi:hypothetical protein